MATTAPTNGAPEDGNPQTAYPTAVFSEYYVQFNCPNCNERNGTVKAENNGRTVVICGACWHATDAEDVS